MTSPRDHRYFFVHVMKTAGGTFVQHAIKNLERHEVYPYRELDDDMDAANVSIPYLVGLPAERHDGLRFYGGHFPHIVSDLLGGDFVVITILRDPVERVVSYLRHCKVHHWQHMDQTPDEIYDDEFFFPCFMDNHQTKLFSMTPDDLLDSYMDVIEIDEYRLDFAKQNLTRVDVLGFQENFDEVLTAMHDRYGWDIGAVSDRHVSDGSEVSASLRRRIADDNWADLQLYEYARELARGRRREQSKDTTCTR